MFFDCLIIGLLLLALPSPGYSQSANISSVITGYGYPLEVHTVITPDGYELILHRIPHGKESAPPLGPVLLQHGLTDASAGWCLNPPGESLAYILADKGYDVWLGNNRGNGYSMNNVNFGSNDSRFWDFCWDELALVDFPSNIEYICSNTNFPKISYIGHSEGTIQAFAGLVANPKLADKLHVYIAIAPVAFVGNLGVELLTILAKLDGDRTLQLFGIKEFDLPTILHKLLPGVCEFNPELCGYTSSFLYGSNSYMNDTRLDLYTDYEPFPTSVKNLIHWAQGVRTNTYQRFDYGTAAANIAHYGQPTPPRYDLTKFPPQLPLVLFTGGIDGLADPVDVAHLVKLLPTAPTVFYRADYGHLDPLLGTNAHILTYPDLVAQLAKYHIN